MKKIKKNLLIQGDNLKGLELLKNQNRKVDCILIDPPYNTGRKMIYQDSFEDWKSFIFPRLAISQELLTEDGVLFCHINDKELFHLKPILDEIYGEENFIENFIWVKNSLKNHSKTVSNNHEYILCYAKNKSIIEKLGFFRKEKEGLKEVKEIKEKFKKSGISLQSAKELEKELKVFYKQNKLKGISQYKKVEVKDHDLAIYRLSDVSAPNKKGYQYQITHPNGNVCKNPQGGWRYSPSKMEELLNTNQIEFGSDHTVVPQFKRYLEDVEQEVCQSVIVNFDEGYDDLKKNIGKEFDNPKPVSLVNHFLNMINKQSFTVLDFFAGSGTIIQAACENQKDISVIAITNNENKICEEITLKRFEKKY